MKQKKTGIKSVGASQKGYLGSPMWKKPMPRPPAPGASRHAGIPNPPNAGAIHQHYWRLARPKGFSA